MWNVSYILFLWCLSTMKSMNTCSTCSTCSLGPWRLTLKRFLMQVPSQYPLARQMVIGKPQVGELGHALHMVCINHGVFMIYWDSLYTDYIWLSLPVSYISVSDYLIISDYIWLYIYIYIYIWLYLIIMHCISVYHCLKCGFWSLLSCRLAGVTQIPRHTTLSQLGLVQF